MNKFIFLILYSFFFGQQTLMSFDDKNVLSDVFFQKVPYSNWIESDSLSQTKLLNQFKELELVYHHSLIKGYDFYPENFMSLYYRKNQLLVNSYYESVVAKPFVNKEYIKETNKNVFDKVFVHHILFGFEGSGLKKTFSRSKEEAFFLADSIKKSLESILSKKEYKDYVEVFSNQASLFSDDPSVAQNKGEVGWVSWGQVMPSFQLAAFNSPVLSVVGPVLTDFGYHLIFVEKRGFSDYYYYNKNYINGLAYKFGLQQTNVDSLRLAAGDFDSLYIKQGGFILNRDYLKSFVDFFNYKTKKENLRGGKNVYIEWLEEKRENDVLFVFNNKGFGVGWFINKIRTSPATRIPTIRNSEDFITLLQSFLLQEGVLVLAKNEKLHEDFVFMSNLKNHSKNILFKFYEKNTLESFPPPDSSLVLKQYNGGVYRGKYLKPKEVVFTEIRVNSKALADSLFEDFLKFGDFEKLINVYGGKLKKPISEGGGGFLGEAAFSLKEGEVSGVIENLNKTFSVIRVERFSEEKPFNIDAVYSQIERKLKKDSADSIKKNLSKSLEENYSVRVYPEVLSF